MVIAPLLPVQVGAATPYVGGSVGLLFGRVSQSHFASIYHCEVEICLPAASTFNTLSLIDVTDAVLTGRIVIGVEYELNSRTVLSAEAAYAASGNLTDRDYYLFHAVPGLWFDTTLSGVQNVTMVAKLRYRLGW